MRPLTRRDLLALGGALLGAPVLNGIAESVWRAGAASVDITPRTSLWMAGFARRRLPAQGTALPLHAKALALQAGDGPPAVLVTADLLGLTARMTDAVAAEAGRRYRLGRAQLLFNASHTHCGPIVDEQLAVAYDLTPERWAAIRAYTAALEAQLVAVIGAALERLQPAGVAFATGTAVFARNRRVAFSADGPVDHTVPVLHVRTAAGAPLAIVFGYACHNTTLQDQFVEYHGDYAGVAQALVEKHHPGATALFLAGCGADANPHPRGTLALVNAHGAALADAVERSLPSATPLTPAITASYGTADLPFAEEDVRRRWRAGLDIEAVYLRRHAELMERIAARDGQLPDVQRAPVQVWRLGSDAARGARPLTLVALGGEVVVDYALRLAREYPAHRIWAAGYSNDVFGYLPSLRILLEGGYEGADAMIYYGRPGPFAEVVEERIMGEVRRQLPASS